jgi:glycosyltransferase involved in cell wall biosynthesis
VSIGLPTFNRASLLGKAIDSVLAQTHRDVELIVSDNASTDGTEALCRERAARDPRMRYMRQPVNLGPTANFNAVLEAARGDHFMWLSDDDWLDANYVSACLAAMTSRPGVTLAGGRCHHYDSAGRLLIVDVPTNLTQPNVTDRLLTYFAEVDYNSIFYGLMPTSLVRQQGMRNAAAADWLVVAGMLANGHAVTVEETRVHRTVGGTSKSIRNVIKVLRLPTYQWFIPWLTIALEFWREIARLPWPAAVSEATRRRVAARVRDIIIIRRTRIRRFLPRSLRRAILRRLSAPLPVPA